MMADSTSTMVTTDPKSTTLPDPTPTSTTMMTLSVPKSTMLNLPVPTTSTLMNLPASTSTLINLPASTSTLMNLPASASTLTNLQVPTSKIINLPVTVPASKIINLSVPTSTLMNLPASAWMHFQALKPTVMNLPVQPSPLMTLQAPTSTVMNLPVSKPTMMALPAQASSIMDIPAPTMMTKNQDKDDLGEDEGSMLMLPPSSQDPSATNMMVVKRDVCQKVKWTKVNPQPAKNSVIPGPRHGHRAIGYRNLMIVFSGGNEGLFEELNVFNTATNEWSQPQVKGDIPTGRASYGAVIDGHRILIFGGMEERCVFSDSLYELNIPKWEWTLLTPYSRSNEERPCARIGHSFTLMKDRVFMFGGLANANPPDLHLTHRVPIIPRYLNELHVLYVRQNMQHGTWEVPVTYGNAPCPRESHSAIGYVSKDGRYNKLVIFGGMFGNRLGDLHTFDIDTMMWSQIKFEGRNSCPRPRSLHTASIIGDRMYIFGGWVVVNNPELISERDFYNMWRCDNSMGCLNLKSMTWERVLNVSARNQDEDEVPGKRAGHSAAVINNKIYIWSGRDGYKKKGGMKNDDKQVCCNDLWKLDTQKPGVANKVRLLKTIPNSNIMLVAWDPVAGADGYILQMHAFEMPHSSTVQQFRGGCPCPSLIPIPK